MSLLSNNTIPNKPLTGKECAAVVVDNVRQMLDADCMFNSTIAYRKLAFTVTVTVHAADTSDTKPRAEAQTRIRPNGVIEGNAPLPNPPEDAQFMAIERKVTVDNPNLTRVHHDLPIRVQQRALPQPNDPFPKIETQELRYEKGDFPPLPEPVDTDVTEREATRLGVPLPAPLVDPLPETPPRRRGRPRKEDQHNLKDAEDLEAISTEDE